MKGMELPIDCNSCEYRFASRQDLKRHVIKFHNDENSYEAACKSADMILAMTVETYFNSGPSNRFSADCRELTFTERVLANNHVRATSMSSTDVSRVLIAKLLPADLAITFGPEKARSVTKFTCLIVCLGFDNCCRLITHIKLGVAPLNLTHQLHVNVTFETPSNGGWGRKVSIKIE